MLWKKAGFPEESEIVLGTVTRILNNSVFISLDEYKDKEGIMHISEVAAGRIRTIREYVKEGKKIVCMVLRVHPERNHLELSLRRVTSSVRLKKNEDLKLEQKTEKILESIAKENKLNFDEFFKKVGVKIIETFGSLRAGIQELQQGNEKAFEKIGIERKVIEWLNEAIKARFKPPEVKIVKDLSVTSKASDGIDIIKESLLDGIKHAKENNQKVEMVYLGSGKVRMSIYASEFKRAEAIGAELITIIEKKMKTKNSEFFVVK